MIVVGVAWALVLGVGAFTLLLRSAASSNDYRSVSPREEAVYARARRDVFPDDVRRNPEQFSDAFVAWPGIIRSVERANEGANVVFKFEIEHRHFDWIEDHSIQREIYFLSRRGEGVFRAAWPIPADQAERVRAEIHDGDMLIVYGSPSAMRGDVIGLFPTEYVRLVPRNLWRDDVLDYGRPGAPSKILKVAY